MSYRVVISAERGYLVGGTRTAESGYMRTRDEAEHWAKITKAVNEKLNRLVGKIEIIEVKYDRDYY